MELMLLNNIKVDKATSPIKFGNLNENEPIYAESDLEPYNSSNRLRNVPKRNHSFIIKSFTNTGIKSLNNENEREKIKLTWIHLL